MSLSPEAAEVVQEARAFWVTGPSVGEIRPAPLQPPSDGHVLVKTLYSGVSRGTEALVFSGRVPVSEHSRMRAPHQEGEFTYPIKYGYAAVGCVLAGVDAGRVVFCLHPHQTAFCVTADDVVDVPSSVPAERAVLAANMETALGAVWDARLSPGDRVVVVGGGAVGCLTARLAARVVGCEVQLVDIDARRRTIADALGVAFALPQDVWAGADVVFHASASASGLQTCIDAAGSEATIVELSWYGDREVAVRLGGAFHPHRLRIVSSQVGSIPSHQSPRWTHRRRMELALRLLEDDALDALFSGESPFDALPNVMAEVAAPGDAPVLCHRIRYP